MVYVFSCVSFNGKDLEIHKEDVGIVLASPVKNLRIIILIHSSFADNL